MKTVLTVHADYRKAQIPADDIAYITVEDRWRKKQSIFRTRERRPDLAENITLPHKTRAEKKFIHELETEWEEYCHERSGKNSETVD